MKSISLFSIILIFLISACSQDNSKDQAAGEQLEGELSTVVEQRNLTEDDLLAAVKTYAPSGSRDEYIAFFGTGVSGRLAVVAMPSMKILKYVAVFSAEAWQGFAYDDQSKKLLQQSSRDEIDYTFGDMGTPALSLTNGAQDGKALFVVDGSNSRLGLVDLKEYETKQVISNPIFKNSNTDISVSTNTDYIAQTTSRPETLQGRDSELVSGATLWHIGKTKGDDHGGYFFDQRTSFSVLLPGTSVSAPVIGRGQGRDTVLSISQSQKPFLNIINMKKAKELLSTKAKNINDHLVFDEKTADSSGILKRRELPEGSSKVVISGDGKYVAITNKLNSQLGLIKFDDLLAGKRPNLVNVGGASVDAEFTDKNLYVTVNKPNQVVKISLSDKKLSTTHELDFPVGDILIPESGTKSAVDRYAVVTNHSPYGRFTRIGPQVGLSAHLLDLRDDEITSLYDASIPQSTRLAAVAMSTEVNKPVYRYKIGTDPRTGKISDFKTFSGKERVVKNGKRVHVFATVIRSHITPDTITVDEGDMVTIHVTSNEQSKDNTHGFTIDSYNIHASYEPGKTASVTFLADRPGVFPFYCTEFCSALHLEMQGYLLVRPVDLEERNSEKLTKMRNNSEMVNFFNNINGAQL